MLLIGARDHVCVLIRNAAQQKQAKQKTIDQKFA